MDRSLHQTSGNDQHKRLVVGWFSFTCCEDSTILFTELLNDHFDEWKKVVEFRHMKALKTNNSLSGLDVAFIEGAISSESQAKEARQIRENAQYVSGSVSTEPSGFTASASWQGSRRVHTPRSWPSALR